MEKVSVDSWTQGCSVGVRKPHEPRLQFKDEVVKEVVERMCSDFSGQCCTHKSSEGNLEASGASGGVMGPPPGPSTSNGSLGYTPTCSSCHKLTSDGAYKCRLASARHSRVLVLSFRVAHVIGVSRVPWQRVPVLHPV